jgi:hypothetical protein
MTDFRTELENAAQELELAENALLCSSFYNSAIRVKAAARRARAALAAEPQGPSDEDLDALFTEVDQSGESESWRTYARAALARWGRAT